LVNEANLVFIDATMAGNCGTSKYMYDFTQPVMFDYAVDESDNTLMPRKESSMAVNWLKMLHYKEATYKIRITNHIRNLSVNKILLM
jgi:hypothetical protein